MNWRLRRDQVHDWFRWLQGEAAYYVRVGCNPVMNRLGLVITTQYNISRLNAQVYELAVAHQRIAELEAQIASSEA